MTQAGVWLADELTAFDAATEFGVSSPRRDGTVRPYRVIWGVVVDGELYVRSVYGQDAAWYRGVLARHRGWVRMHGAQYEVSCAEVTDERVQARIDEGYRRKYAHRPAPMRMITSSLARSATLRVSPER